MLERRDIEFKTLDGLVLRGWLYPTPTRSPAVVITPGLNCVKEMFVPDVAEWFQSAGVNALVYDPRTLGDSDGLPRNDIDPLKQISDYSDALSFLRTQTCVDPDRIAFWGMSMSATVALCAAALDKRAKACIAICPMLGFEPPPEKLPHVLAKAMQDRQSCTVGGNGPTYIPLLMSDGRNPAGLGFQAGPDELDFMINAKERTAPNYENRTTLQTYYKLLTWQPHGIVKYLNTPIMMIIPELDRISPPDGQKDLFKTFPEPKLSHVVPGRGHLNVISGEEFPELMSKQVLWLQEYLEIA
ncbi:related to DltD N-terminal domain protein [Neofusicoccum parvum]|uniref:Related to DltD N-terminal domain protein n=1 Tax=Neofusicoccum parvum TaxID=310453 RepID=A0ACB5SQZ6_9PEZI|nr:related to DltD N-terminal domain protein [Neofusicoccum parvum]